MFQEGVGVSHTSLRIIQLFYIIIVVITIDNRIIANIARIGKIGGGAARNLNDFLHDR